MKEKIKSNLIPFIIGFVIGALIGLRFIPEQ